MQLNGVEFVLAEVRKHSGQLPSACDFPIGYHRSVITRGLFRFESGTGDFHRQTVERRACGDEERFVVLFSKTNVGWSLGNLDRFEQLSIGRVNLNLITVGRVEVSEHIHGHPVASRVDLEEFATELAVVVDFIALNARW